MGSSNGPDQSETGLCRVLCGKLAVINARAPTLEFQILACLGEESIGQPQPKAHFAAGAHLCSRSRCHMGPRSRSHDQRSPASVRSRRKPARWITRLRLSSRSAA